MQQSPDFSQLVSDLKAFNARLGLKKRLGGVQYGRVIEYARAYQLLQPRDARSLLDLGTGKHSIFPLFCAFMNPQLTCRITDIGDYVNVQRRVAERIPQLAAAFADGRLSIQVQDATAISYPDASFDAVSAISTIEHIPDNGDSAAVREAFRVLKPGGKLLVTVPMAHGGQAYDIYRTRTSYLRAYRGAPTFFQHTYDESTLRARLLDVAPFADTSYEMWDDGGFYHDIWCKHVPFRNALKYAVGWWLTDVSLRRYRMVATYSGTKASLAIVSCTK